MKQGYEQIMLVQSSPRSMNNVQQLQEDIKDQPEQLQEEPLKVKQKRYPSFVRILLAVVSISLSSFYFGYTIIYLSVIDFNAVMRIFGIDMGYSTAEGLLTFCVPIGGLFGSLLSSYFISKFSRRQTILTINAAAFVLGILPFFAGFKFYMLIRFGQGMCAGIFSAVVPLIIKEIAPFELSGFFGVFQQLFITMGIFTASFFSFILGLITKDETGEVYWRWLFGFPLVTITLQSVLLLTVYKHETPKYLVDKNREDQARRVLEKLYYPEFVDEVLREMRKEDSSVSSQTGDSDGSAGAVQREVTDLPITRKVAIHLAVLQQLVGISAVSTYGRELAEGSLEGLKPVFPSLLNFVQVAFSAVSAFLLNKYGRKTILQFGTAGAAVSNIVIALGFWLDGTHPTLALVLILGALFYYMANFNMSLGPIVWMYIPEIVQPSFLPYSTMVNWGFSALSILLFPIIKEHLPGSNPAPMFLFFAIWSAGSFLGNQKYLVQTMGKTPKQIQDDFRRVAGKASDK